MQGARNGSLSSALAGQHVHRDGIVGHSRAIDHVIRRIELVSATQSTVLITGETGTGKELVARAVHSRSAQRHMPFIRVNCAAIPETLLESELFGHVRGAFTGATVAHRGKFALANHGTIFLDEIGATSVTLQAKLLRVLQEREIEPLGAERTEQVDVRVIAATNRNLRQLVADGRFQDDLYYRLHVFPIVMPALRERVEDIPMLAAYFIDKHARRFGRSIDAVEAGAIASLEEYHWPGNVRELENTIERAIVLTTGSTITRDAITIDATTDVRSASLPSLKLQQNLEWIACATIRQALAMSTGKKEAARIMGISPRALSYYLGKYPFLDQPRTDRRGGDVFTSPSAKLAASSPAPDDQAGGSASGFRRDVNNSWPRRVCFAANFLHSDSDSNAHPTTRSFASDCPRGFAADAPAGAIDDADYS